MFNIKIKFEKVYRVLMGLRSKDSVEIFILSAADTRLLLLRDRYVNGLLFRVRPIRNCIEKLFIDNREFGKSQ